MVDKHIKSLLYDHDCVIIPDFGGLIARYVSARINPVKHTLVPPSKRIAFNEKLVLSDGLLISTFAHAKGVSHEEAQRLVAEFVHQAKVKLDAENRFEIHGIGIFRYNTERRIEFEYVEADNLLEDSFGLPELVARPLRVEEPAVLRTLIKERHLEPVTVKMPLRRRLKRIYNVTAGLVLGGIAVTGVYLLSLQTDYNLSSLNPISLFSAGYAMPGQVASKYAADYEPFSEEDRATAYEDIIPSYTVTLLDEAEEEAFLSEAGEEATEEVTALEEPTGSIAATEEVQTASIQEVKPADEVAEAVAETKEPVLTINEKTGRFYVITGGYARLKNAEENRDGISQKGFAAKVLIPGRGSRLFKVSVADFATAEEAQAAVPALRKTFGETIWVFNN